MKQPLMLLAALAAIAIVVAASFGLAVDTTTPDLFLKLPESVRGSALFVCPAADSIFDEISHGLLPFRNQLTIAFFFFFIFLCLAVAWAFYQNLIKDKFELAKEKERYSFQFFLAKVLFWVTIVMTILMHSPNSFRTVGIRGVDGQFVLCESNTPGARPVRADAVIVRSTVQTQISRDLRQGN